MFLNVVGGYSIVFTIKKGSEENMMSQPDNCHFVRKSPLR